MKASHKSSFLLSVLLFVGCAEVQSPHVIRTEKPAEISRVQTIRTRTRTTTVEQRTVTQRGVAAGSGITLGNLGPPESTTPSVPIFPTNQTIRLESGGTYVFGGCREVDASITQIMRSSIVWNSVAIIKCTNGQKTEEAKFECGGTNLDVELVREYRITCSSPRSAAE
jgi:hypothetical protein